MEIARACPETTLSGMGGIETGWDAAQFMLLGAHTVQVCTGAMLRGYEIIGQLKDELDGFMAEHDFTSLRDFIGKSLPYFSTHADLVSRQAAARTAKKAARQSRDNDWKGNIAQETNDLTAG